MFFLGENKGGETMGKDTELLLLLLFWLHWLFAAEWVFL